MNPALLGVIGVPVYSAMIGLTMAILDRIDPGGRGGANVAWAFFWPFALLVGMFILLVMGPGFLTRWLASPKENS